MKMKLLFPLLVMCIVTFQVRAQDDVSGIVKPVAMQDIEPEAKTMRLPVVNLSAEEIKAYEDDPENKPRLDFKPIGKKPQSKTAGKSYLKASKQIIGGSRAALSQFPWQIYLLASGGWLCGGSLIAPNWVLTAAHCVKGSRSFTITAGGLDRSTTEANERSQTSTVFTIHKSYSSTSLVNDIAVIKLPNNFPSNSFINTVRLPKQSDASRTFAGNTVTASGYGKTANTGGASNVLNFVDLTVITNSVCAGVFGTGTVKSTCICTKADPDKSICSGDSGGPLMNRETDGLFIQIGIVSFGAAASCTNYPAGYTRVTSYLGWISSTTGIAIAK